METLQDRNDDISIFSEHILIQKKRIPAFVRDINMYARGRLAWFTLEIFRF